jgi:5-(carboxyamino)imidazole ribonucleotide synthase
MLDGWRNMTENWRTTGKRPKVGVVGGGQLARMLVQASISLDVELHVLALEKDESLKSLICSYEVVSDYSPSALYQFARKCDVVTFEHELIEYRIIDELENRGCVMRPGSHTFRVASDKDVQRKELSAAALPVPPHLTCHSMAEVEGFANAIRPPFVLKATRYGYDGRGVIFADSVADAEAQLGKEPFDTPYVMEPRLDIDYEFAIVTVSPLEGEILTYPPLITRQSDGICVEVSTEEIPDQDLKAKAIEIAKTIARLTRSVGIQAVEFFVTKDGELLVNELAPRVHNSAHLTADACVTSQFENHLRAVLNLPLGSTELLSDAVMVNLIGPIESGRWHIDRDALLSDPSIKVHLYSKTVRARRKVGHITVLGRSLETARETARAAASKAFVKEIG